jgi:hypothetical protein
LRRKSLLQNFFSNGFNILAVDANSEVELCTPTWLKHDYGDGGVVNILAVDAYSGVDVCMPIFIIEMGELLIYWWWTHILEWMYACQYLWVRLAINVGGKLF